MERAEDGTVRIFVAGERVNRRLERIVGAVLERQLEHSLAPALLDPGWPVEVGDAWELDPRLARRLLRARGVRVIEFGEAATARLERLDAADAAGDLVIRYRIPIAWFELDGVPPNTRTAESEGRLEGEIRLSAERTHVAPTAHVSSLALRMNGLVAAAGIAPPSPWKVESEKRFEQSTRRIETAFVPASPGSFATSAHE